ncbi:MAG TPA: hypothetical protein HA302_01275 [Thermococcaceae archaeon]|uniref:Transglutaminase-like domain-containing protein n=2 Tax=Thermococcus sibiricus TaxID=172049 RepID=C6A2W4_THESM|nr:transglutaminase-like domain-containing protein [Thermococcus sibiricus]ACS89959.1 hypothetical protein TSIB_0901 [Thermococcus sibiricus MM 739]KUK18557.1 MAG: Uncharacterized protein XD54_0117 [Thermococcus sibiricus]KUK29432.1 MAG: Uncharacterized protein XD61_0078 [Thermococcus sp. 40_45]HII66652.1 hypothetical protein [Thermococcaceae archaeon]
MSEDTSKIKLIAGLFILLILLSFSAWYFTTRTKDETKELLPTSTTSKPSPTTTTPFQTTTETTSTTTITTAIETTTSLPESTRPSTWRYIFKEALKYGLSSNELTKISYLAIELKGQTIQESVWNILEWLQNNIEYDSYKASLPAPTIQISENGTIIGITGGEGTEIQTPYETIKKGKGICTDYTILTLALMLEMDYSLVYAFEISFENSNTKHVTAAIKIDDEYFLLDQNLPPMDLGTYYNKWALYREEKLLISNATVYEIQKSGESLTIKIIGIMPAEDFKNRNYDFTSANLAVMANDLMELFLENYPNLSKDFYISDIDKKVHLPYGYANRSTWKLELPNFIDYYTLTFHREFVKYFYRRFTENPKVVKDLSEFNRLWIRVERDQNTLRIVLNLAERIES